MKIPLPPQFYFAHRRTGAAAKKIDVDPIINNIKN